MMKLQSAILLVMMVPAVGGLLAACEPDTQATQERSVRRGETLFAENCSPCHGAQGRGPSMDEIRALSPDGLRSAIRNHPTAGQIPERLPAARVQEIIEYLEE